MVNMRCSADIWLAELLRVLHLPPVADGLGDRLGMPLIILLNNDTGRGMYKWQGGSTCLGAHTVTTM